MSGRQRDVLHFQLIRSTRQSISSSIGAIRRNVPPARDANLDIRQAFAILGEPLEESIKRLETFGIPFV